MLPHPTRILVAVVAAACVFALIRLASIPAADAARTEFSNDPSCRSGANPATRTGSCRTVAAHLDGPPKRRTFARGDVYDVALRFPDRTLVKTTLGTVVGSRLRAGSVVDVVLFRGHPADYVANGTLERGAGDPVVAASAARSDAGYAVRIAGLMIVPLAIATIFRRRNASSDTAP